MIECAGLGHDYRDLTALDDFDLQLDRGQAFGLIGPNGAGKTTLLRILATVLHPTRGEARVAGYSVVREPNRVRRVLGYVPDQFGLYDGLRVKEFLELFSGVKGVPSADRHRVIGHVLELTDLVDRAESYTEELSKGMRQRLCLAEALLADPEVLILDEPAAGLDPRARVEFREFMRELRQMGKTLVVSSHILPELASFCTCFGFLKAGRMRVLGSPEDILDRAGASPFRVHILDNPGLAVERLAAIPEVVDVRRDQDLIRFDHPGAPAKLAEILRMLVENDHQPCDFHREAVTFEAAFMSLTEEDSD